MRKEGRYPHQIFCTAVLPEELKLLTIAVLEVQRQEDRHPCSEYFSRIQLSAQCRTLQVSDLTKTVGIFIFYFKLQLYLKT